jgi:hypothetical protein
LTQDEKGEREYPTRAQIGLLCILVSVVIFDSILIYTWLRWSSETTQIQEPIGLHEQVEGN